MLPPWKVHLCLAGESELAAFELERWGVEAQELGLLRIEGSAHVQDRRPCLQVHGWPKQSEELVASPLGRPLCGCWRSSAGSKSPPPHEPSTQSFLCCPQSHPQLPETAGTPGATPVCCFQKITVLCSILLSWNRRNHFISPSADVTLNLKTCCLCEDVTSFLLVQYWLPRYILMQKTEKN